MYAATSSVPCAADNARREQRRRRETDLLGQFPARRRFRCLVLVSRRAGRRRQGNATRPDARCAVARARDRRRPPLRLPHAADAPAATKCGRGGNRGGKQSARRSRKVRRAWFAQELIWRIPLPFELLKAARQADLRVEFAGFAGSEQIAGMATPRPPPAWQPDKVVGGESQGEHPVDAGEATLMGLATAGGSFAPAKHFLNALAHPPTDSAAGVAPARSPGACSPWRTDARSRRRSAQRSQKD
jgi:hypothetical protein